MPKSRGLSYRDAGYAPSYGPQSNNTLVVRHTAATSRGNRHPLTQSYDGWPFVLTRFVLDLGGSFPRRTILGRIGMMLNLTSRNRVSSQFLLAALIAGCAVIGALVASAWLQHHREQQLAKRIVHAGGRVLTDTRSPQWLPPILRRSFLFDRVFAVFVHSANLDDSDVAELQTFTDLTELMLTETRISDAGLVEVGQLRHLTTLSLDETRVTDAGLENLLGLTHLQSLDLAHTRP